MAQTMLDAGTDVNLAAVNGVTPLMAAAYGGQTEMVDAAARARAPTSTPSTSSQKNAMTYAAGDGRTEIVVLLLAHGRRSERRLSQRPDRAHVGRRLRQDRTP